MSLVSIELQQDPKFLVFGYGKLLCDTFQAFRSSTLILFTCCCTAQIVYLWSHPMFLEPLHKWLANLCHGIMIPFGCSNEVKSQIISSFFYSPIGFSFVFHGR